MRHWIERVLLGCVLGLAALAPARAQDAQPELVTHDSWWLPPNHSLEGRQIDAMFTFIFVVTVLTMIGVFAVLVWFLIKYRYRPDRRSIFIHGHHKAELIWTLTPTVILVVMGILSIRAWGQLRLDKPGPDRSTTEVEVLAQQFQWNFRYAGKDGRFGTPDDVGTFDPNDAIKSPIVGTFYVPVNKTVRIHLMSRDVLHSFFLPNMRTKMDAVPGLRGDLWFTPTQVGRYDLACAELCGPQHYSMRGEMVVLSAEDFAAWMKERQAEVAEQIGEEAPPETAEAEEEEAGEKAPPKPKAPEPPAVEQGPETSFEQVAVTSAADEGVIKGRVVFDGAPPPPRKFKVDADAHCKKVHPQGFNMQTVSVKDGGLANVFVHVKSGLPGDKVWEIPSEPVVLDQKGCEYHPHVFGMMAGQGLKVTNSDPTNHNIHGLPTANPGFNFGQPQKGMEKIVDTIRKSETFRIKCDVHDWMNAHCFVLNHPFFATTDEAGNFVIKNLPPGTYDIEFWHESLGAKTLKGVKIEPGKAAAVSARFKPKKR